MGEMILNGRLYGANGIRELTQSQYDALPASKYTDGVLYCIKDSGIVEGEQFAPVIYSLAERQIGTWTDGKPLYQRTIHFTVDNTSGYKRFTTDIVNAETVLIDFSASYYLGSGLTKIPLVGYLGSNMSVNYLSNALAILGTVVDNYLCVDYRAGENVFGASAVVTVRYTKTTDIPGSGDWTTEGVPTHHYSTSEKVIGTWIDGKPLYEKSYYGVVAYTTVNQYVDLFSVPSTIDILVSINATLGNTAGTNRYSLDHADESGKHSFVKFHTENNNSVIQFYSEDTWNGARIAVTIQYTKSS